MNVVVSGSMHEQQLRTEAPEVSHHGRLPVAFLVEPRKPHESLGVDRVVQTPVSNRRHRDAHAENVASASRGHGRHVATVAPAPNADPAAVNPALPGEPLRGVYLILRFRHAQLQLRSLPEVATTPRSTPV